VAADGQRGAFRIESTGVAVLPLVTGTGVQGLSLVKPPHRTRLAELQATCAVNYARFLQLFPAYEQCNRREFAVGEARVVMEVQERSR
jgi:hypothetical protein